MTLFGILLLCIFYRYYFGRCLSDSELAQLDPLPYSQETSTHYSDRLHDFSVTISRCYRDVYVNSFFPCTGRLWSFLPIEYFSFAYDLNGFKSKINRHLLTAVLSEQILLSFNLVVLLFYATPCLVVAVQPCMSTQSQFKKKQKTHRHTKHFKKDTVFAWNS